MKYYYLDLTAVSPLAIRADHAPGGAGNARYIPGTTLVGSLATVYRLSHSEEDGNFKRLFLSGEVQYPNLYPASFEHKEMEEMVTLPVYPVPKTAQSCKRFSGFKRDDSDDPRHGVRDSLFDWVVFELGDQTHEALKSLLDHRACGKCKRAMHHFSGFYRRQEKDRFGMASAGVDTRLQTHTGIDRSTGTVQEGILYNRQVFEERSRFWGLAKLPDDLAQPFKQFIREIGETGLVRVGTGRSRGLGKVHLRTESLDGQRFEFAAFEQRLRNFNYQLQEQVIAQELPGLVLAPFYFTLTLHSPAILYDPALRYRGSITEETLKELLSRSLSDDNKELLKELVGPDSQNFKLIYQNADIRRITGWNEIWGTPKANEFAIDTGSVFLFASQVKTKELSQALFQLEEAGIGQRRTEGFGRVCISDPFHLEVKLR